MAFQFDLSPATGSLLRHNTLQKHPVQRLVDLSLFTSMRINVSKSVSGSSRVTDNSSRMSFFSPSKADPERMADFCNRQSAL